MAKQPTYDTFGAMPGKSMLENIMDEVANLNRSIREICPEIGPANEDEASSPVKSEELDYLIEHRVQVLSDDSEIRRESRNI